MFAGNDFTTCLSPLDSMILENGSQPTSAIHNLNLRYKVREVLTYMDCSGFEIPLVEPLDGIYTESIHYYQSHAASPIVIVRSIDFRRKWLVWLWEGVKCITRMRKSCSGRFGRVSAQVPGLDDKGILLTQAFFIQDEAGSHHESTDKRNPVEYNDRPHPKDNYE